MIIHYLKFGAVEGRTFSPLFDNDAYKSTFAGHVRRTKTGSILEDFSRSADRGAAFHWFDVEHYRDQAGLEISTDINRCLEHFLIKGLELNLSPHPLVTLPHLADSADLASSYTLFLDIFSESPEGDLSAEKENSIETICNQMFQKLLNVQPDTDHQQLIRQAGIFNAEWYAARYPELVEIGIDLERHYLEIGYLEERSPHPLFWPEYYRNTYPDIREDGAISIIHYLRRGGREQRECNPFIEFEKYYDTYNDKIIDVDSGSVLEDFCRNDDRSKAFSFFNAKYYCAQLENQDLNLPPNRALEHFLSSGLPDGLDPHVLIQIRVLNITGELSQDLKSFSSLFTRNPEANVVKTHPLTDPAFCLRRNPEISTHPVIHYLRNWKQTEVYINPLFVEKYYSARHGLSAPECDINPLTHYLSSDESQLEKPNAYFDPRYYIQMHGEHLKDNEHPLVHYMREGSAIWFDPSENFSQRYYLKRNPALVKNQEVPLIHYLHGGMEAGNTPMPPRPFFDATTGLSAEEIVNLIHEVAPSQIVEPKVSVIIPAYKNIEYTLRCIYSILCSGDKTPIEIVVADDCSPDDSGKFLQDSLSNIANLHIRINPNNLGFLQSCNYAVSHTRAPLIFLLNNDTYVLPGWIDELVETFQRERQVGIAGSKLIYPNGLLQEAGGVVWSTGAANYGRMDDPSAPEYSYQRDVDYISGAAILVSRNVWNTVGGFSEELAPAYYEDTDLAMKVREAGLRVIYQPLSTIIHFEGISSGTDLASGVKKYQVVNREKFEKKWQAQLNALGNTGDFSPQILNRYAKGRILIYDAEVPMPDHDSGSVTAFLNMKILCELGYQVTFVCSCLRKEGHYATNLQRFGVEVVHQPYVQNAHEFVLKNGGDYDMIILSRASHGGVLVGRVKHAFPEVPVVFDTVDIHHLRLQRQFQLSGDVTIRDDAVRMKQIELSAIQLADTTLVVSEFEVDYLRHEIGHFPHLVLPLVYEEHHRQNGFGERKDIAFIGGYRHPPNIDAVEYLVNEIWPLYREFNTGARLHIIGSHMPPEFQEFAADDITVVGFVDDLESYLETIRITVAPLRYGAGVKGKVGNSLRMGVPVIATPIAAEGMGLIADEHVLVAADPQSFAAQMHSAYEDAARWEKMSQSGQAFVMNEFGVSSARKKIIEFMQQLDQIAKIMMYTVND